MTLSENDRRENLTLALRLIGDEVGEKHVGTELEREQPAFKTIFPTTWEALVDAGHLYQTDIWHYQLTAKGWIEILRITGRLCSEEMKRNLGNLCGIFKKCLEEANQRLGQPNRTHEEKIDISVVVSQSGFPEPWIYNVIDSYLIELCLKQIGIFWAEDDENKNYIIIPIDFGLPLSQVDNSV